MAFAIQGHTRYQWLFDRVSAGAAQDPALADCRLSAIPVPPASDAQGAALIDGWAATPQSRRATVLLAHEPIAALALGELQARGWRCPRDVSLIGLSRTTLSDSTQPRLTGIDNPIEALARAAVKLLIDHVESERQLTPADAPRPVACRFVVRESCGPVPVECPVT